MSVFVCIPVRHSDNAPRRFVTKEAVALTLVRIFFGCK